MGYRVLDLGLGWDCRVTGALALEAVQVLSPVAEAVLLLAVASKSRRALVYLAAGTALTHSPGLVCFAGKQLGMQQRRV